MKRGQRWLRWAAAPAVLCLAFTAAMPQGRTAQPQSTIAVSLVPEPGTEFAFGRWTYGGELSINWRADGLVVVEEAELDRYLAGIREVPLSWPAAALEAQAVAARTYLAWTLARGRTRDGRIYDFDICATTLCQVYAGTSVVNGRDGDRWLDAVSSTQDEILLWEGAPAQALYSSSAGRRTRSVEDIWGSTPKPYLVAVDSPEAGVTPYARWEITLDVEVLRRIFAAGGITIGSQVRSMAVDRPPDGGGVTMLVIDSNTGVVKIPATTVRSRINRYGPLLYPELLPATRPDGRRWPQPFLSYNFDVVFRPVGRSTPPPFLHVDDLPSPGHVTFVGEGWGHGVGMSQWGAKAMADLGFTYDQILAHYYGGLLPIGGGASIPETVRVGLAWERDEVRVTASGPFELRMNGVPVVEATGGVWSFHFGPGGIAVVPPGLDAALTSLLGARRWPR